MSNKELLQLKRILKEQIQHTLNTIDIKSVHYSIYRDDSILGRKLIETNILIKE